MFRFFIFFVFFLCIFFFAVTSLPCVFASESKKELLIGIEPEHNIFHQMERYRILAGYLSDEIGVKINLKIMSRYGEVIKRFKTMRLDGAFLTSYTASLGIRKLHLEPIANPVNLNGESSSNGYIVVRKDSGINDVRSMRGKSIVFVDPASMEGYLFPLVYLKKQGVNDINKYFQRVYFSGSHASTFFAVLDGRADIGSAKNTVFNKLVMNDQSIQKELKIIAESIKAPEITLCMKNEIDENLRDKISSVLLNMDKTSKGQKILKQFQAIRFVKSIKDDFIVINSKIEFVGLMNIRVPEKN